MAKPNPCLEVERRRLTVRGVVQGVGFRPFVFRLAQRLALAGWVRNESGEVTVEVEGPPEALERFAGALRKEAPRLAYITAVESMVVTARGNAAFRIEPSVVQEGRRQPIAPDVAMCAECETELFDAADRRYRYPFITCTDCGPRFTIIEDMPYDRARTSMRRFDQCRPCLNEYTNPADRRYHSETNSCPTCGPRLWLAADEDHASDPIEGAARILVGGGIVAIRGLGGFHLAVNATDNRAVQRLRDRKQRDEKPFAIMVRTLSEAGRIARMSPEEARLLRDRSRPVVVLRRRSPSPLAPGVAPRLDSVGIMLAYTPIHHLLLQAVGRPLVMTSGNLSDEPIAIANDEATRRLAGVADAFLLHDREIVARYDDSVVRVAGGTPVFLRRARGYAPMPLQLPVESPVPLLAVGPHLKNTFTLAHGCLAYVSQHVGDLETLETLEHFRVCLDTYQRLFGIDPKVVIRDLHPGYLSTRVADELQLGPVFPVQHHFAHIAAVTGEHCVTEPVIGVAYDGSGYGDDGHVWGAEFFVCDVTSYQRVGHLRYAPLPGGDAAARAPWRAALGYRSLISERRHVFSRAFDGIAESELHMAEQQAEKRINSPMASSMGRLFDAAAAIIGLRRIARYEGQPPMELDAVCTGGAVDPLPFPVVEAADGLLQLDPIPLLLALDDVARRGEEPGSMAAQFHESVAVATATLVARVAAEHGCHTVALGGGVFQNARLVTRLRELLGAGRLAVLLPRALSPNDGAISYGQAVVGAARMAAAGGM